MDDEEQRDLVVRGGPQHARAEVEVAVTDDRHRQPAELLVRERAADRGRRVVADAKAAAVAVVAIGLVVIQQPTLPVARELMSGDDRPVVVGDLIAELGDHARHADRAGVPPVPRLANAIELAFLVRRGDALCRAPAIALLRSGVDLPTDFLDQRRQRRLGVGGDRQVDVGVAAEVVDVAALEQVLGARC